MKFYNCVVCRVKKSTPGEWFCSHECHLKHMKDPKKYCIICTPQTAKSKVAHTERRRLSEQELGRRWNDDEGLIMMCENQECINMSHSMMSTRNEMKNFWQNVRAKRERSMWRVE